MQVTFNDQPFQIGNALPALAAAQPTLALLLEITGVSQSLSVAVALNGKIAPRSSWASLMLNEHDQILVVVPSQGG